MPCYELFLGDRSLRELLSRIAADANAVAPGLGRERARRIAETILRTRVGQTTSCGRHLICDAVQGPVWGRRERPPSEPHRPVYLQDADARDLPRIFAAAAVDALDAGNGDERAALEERLASVFHMALSPRLFLIPFCRHVDVCHAPATDPFAE